MNMYFHGESREDLEREFFGFVNRSNVNPKKIFVTRGAAVVRNLASLAMISGETIGFEDFDLSWLTYRGIPIANGWRVVQEQAA